MELLGLRASHVYYWAVVMASKQKYSSHFTYFAVDCVMNRLT